MTRLFDEARFFSCMLVRYVCALYPCGKLWRYARYNVYIPLIEDVRNLYKLCRNNCSNHQSHVKHNKGRNTGIPNVAMLAVCIKTRGRT